jgi:hypothetical protein
MLPMAGLTPRSVFPTAMAAAAVPGTRLTEPAVVPRRICRKPTASASITVSRLTRMAEKHITKPHAHVIVLCTLTLASCLMLAQQNAPNTQGITPPPASPTPTTARMTFFVTSVGLGKGGDLGGLAGADAHCQALAAAVGAGGHTWHAYLSTQARPGQPAVNARDRIGTGPWFNWSFAQLGAPQNAIISADLAELHGDTLVQAQRGSNLFKQSTRNEHGQVIHGIGDTPPIQHEILTGSKWDGRAYVDNADHTCNNWTSSSTGSAQVGHSDRIGNGSSWNSSNATKGCSQAALESSGGAGLFYCFAIN